MESNPIVELRIIFAGKHWLTIGIPTIPRKDNTDYLSRTLSTLLEELPQDPTDLLYRRVKVIVMNNRPGNHTAWEKVSQLQDALLGLTEASRSHEDIEDVSSASISCVFHPDAEVKASRLEFRAFRLQWPGKSKATL